MGCLGHLELSSEYQELGDVLGEMAELGEGDGSWVEAPVLNMAQRVAAEFMNTSFPVPQLFTHGSNSVVFTWARGSDNLYFTVSVDKAYALISTPEQITWRMEWPLADVLNKGCVCSVRSGRVGSPTGSGARRR